MRSVLVVSLVVLAGCPVKDDGEPCTTAELAVQRCAGERVEKCDGKIWTAVEDCAAAQRACVTAGTTASCTGASTSCDSTQEGNRRCTGTTLQRCEGGSWTTLQDCSALGHVCAGGGASAAQCQPPTPPCTSSSACAEGFLCVREQGVCRECRATLDCGFGQVCTAGACAAASPCQSDLDCTPQGMVCDAAGHRCVQCNGAAECGGKACLGHTCVQATACTSSLDCASRKMVCGPALPPAYPSEVGGQACAECNSSADCGAGEACLERMCHAVCRAAGRTCGSVLDVSCGTCAQGTSCLASGTACAASIPMLGGELAADGADRIFVGMNQSVPGYPTLQGVVELLDGATTPSPIQQVQGEPLMALAVGSATVFWATGAQLWSRAKSGGAVDQFPRFTTYSDSECAGLAVVEPYVLCALRNPWTPSENGILKLWRTGATGVTMQMVESLQVAPRILARGDEVFWSDYAGTMVAKTTLSTHQRTVLASGAAEIEAIAGGYLYYRRGNGNLERVALSGGGGSFVRGSIEKVVGSTEDRLYLLDASSATGLALIETDLLGANAHAVLEPEDMLPLITAVFRHPGALYVVGGPNGYTLRLPW